MLPGEKVNGRTYRRYAIDLQGDSSLESHHRFLSADATESEPLQPLQWPDHLCSPLRSDSKQRLLAYIKGDHLSVWRVLVESNNEEAFVNSVVLPDSDVAISAFFHPKLKGAIYASGTDAYDVDNFLHKGRKHGLRCSRTGSVIKELLTTTEAYLLLFHADGPIDPEEGAFVRLLPSANYPNALAYVVKTESDTQIAHLLVLPVRIEYANRVGNENTATAIPHLERVKGKLAHDYRKYAYGLIRGQAIFDCLYSRNICPSRKEIEVLEECDFVPIRDAIQTFKCNIIADDDRVRATTGEFAGLVGWAVGSMVCDNVQVMPITSILNHDIAGIEISATDVNKFELRNGQRVMVIHGPFSGVTVEVIDYLDDDTIHAAVAEPSVLDLRAKVYSHEIIRIVEIGDYVEVIKGPFEGCMGYAAEDRWQSCHIYVDAEKDINTQQSEPADSLLQTWINVDYNNLRIVKAFQLRYPRITARTVEDKEYGMDDQFAAHFVGMEVYIVHHQHLKGSQGRILDTVLTRTEDGRQTRRFTVRAFHSISAYTYQMKERELLEAWTYLPIRVAARRISKIEPPTCDRSSTPDNTNDTITGDGFGITFEDYLTDGDATQDEVKARVSQQIDSDGSWLLDQRLMHKKLEIQISGTRGGNVFRHGVFEGCKGYTVVTAPIRHTSNDIFVKIDSIDSAPMSRVPVKFLWPKSSSFPPNWRVVIKGATVENAESYIGSHGLIIQSPYELGYGIRMVFILPSGPYDYFDISSLCSCGEKVEWLGYTY